MPNLSLVVAKGTQKHSLAAVMPNLSMVVAKGTQKHSLAAVMPNLSMVVARGTQKHSLAAVMPNLSMALAAFLVKITTILSCGETFHTQEVSGGEKCVGTLHG